MQSHFIELLEHALTQLRADGTLPEQPQPPIKLDRTKDAAHGDYASNIALMLAKPAGLPPRELAEKIITQLPASEAVAKVEIAGPGFINIFQAGNVLTDGLKRMRDGNQLGINPPEQPLTVVVDYSSPNLAKEMHVGHLRSTIIGDAVARTLEYLGHKVIRQNHVGDWGTQFGMLLAYLESQQTDNSTLTEELADLEEFYRQAKLRFDESPDFANRSRELVVALQSGDEYCLQLWEQFNTVSMQHCFDVYERLGVSLTAADVRGESAYNDDLPSVVAALKEQGLLTESEGAQCVFLDSFKNKDGDVLPVIVQKADGGYLYATSDLAALRYRQEALQADRILYFVDQRQGLHFQQIFAVANAAGFVKPSTELAHMGFGTMNGKDGRPFKTRTGGTVKLVDLLIEAEDRALALVASKNPDFDQSTLQHIAHTVGIGAVKYADLSKNRSSDYIFNFDQMLSFDGNTAPYLLYAYTRVASVFRRAGIEPTALKADIQLDAPQEIALAQKLLAFQGTLEQVADKGLPNLLCQYLYELAGLFSSFYEHCPILSTEDEQLKNSRLQLAAITAKTLHDGLNLLGINTLERM